MAVIAYFMHGRGRGHAIRAASIVPRLREAGHDVTTFGGGASLDIFGNDPTHVEVELNRRGPIDGAISFARRLRSDMRALRHLKPGIVIVDGDPAGMITAAMLRLPRIAVGHDVIFARCRLTASMPRRLIYRQRVKSWFISFAHVAVGVNFVPLSAQWGSTLVARPVMPVQLQNSERGTIDDRKPRVICYFRDGNGDEIARTFARAGADVSFFGRTTGIEGVDTYEFSREAFLQKLSDADAVAGSAGVNLLSEAVYAGKPVYACHHANEAEQTLNGKMISGAGLGIAQTFDHADQVSITRFLKRVRAHDFSQLDLETALPEVGQAVMQAIAMVAR